MRLLGESIDRLFRLLYIINKKQILLYNREENKMEMYREAYEYYTETCENLGIESINFYHFINHLTEEQLEEYIKKAS